MWGPIFDRPPAERNKGGSPRINKTKVKDAPTRAGHIYNRMQAGPIFDRPRILLLWGPIEDRGPPAARAPAIKQMWAEPGKTKQDALRADRYKEMEKPRKCEGTKKPKVAVAPIKKILEKLKLKGIAKENKFSKRINGTCLNLYTKYDDAIIVKYLRGL